MTPYGPGAEQWLTDLRLLLMIGFVATLALWFILQRADSSDSPAPPVFRGKAEAKAFCPLHRRLVGTCPPGTHDDE